MTNHQRASDILNRWPSRKDVAADTGASLTAVHRWFWRDRIPPEYFLLLAEAAHRRGITLSLEEIAASRREPAA